MARNVLASCLIIGTIVGSAHAWQHAREPANDQPAAKKPATIGTETGLDPEQDITKTDPKAAGELEARLLAGARQLTFEGRRAGEGYFSRDGSKLVFQSEREPDNPFFQIYLMDLETGDLDRVSPGLGKTTCAWIHPDGGRVLFASTHGDPDARAKQVQEIESRKAGKERRYSWDYDEHFDLYVYDQKTQEYTNLTNARGYDAEGSYSPDGQWIAFASNRRAYTDNLTDEQKTLFEQDPASMMEIYLMRADGTGLRQLTNVPGYDGGPFFSPDGRKICWRRFSENGAVAEVMTMNVDGSQPRALTRLGAMSWAPFFHPSGDYLIFTTNRHGFGNFELYLIDAEARSEPIRVTHTAGFDGLPVFTPDGKRLAWTTNRTPNQQSQIYIADWNDAEARRMLGLDSQAARERAGTPARKVAREEVVDDEARAAAAEAIGKATQDFSPEDILRHVDYLCRPELGGRLTGTRGEKMATAYVASYFESLGLLPAGDDGTWFQSFEFTSGVSLGPSNKLAAGDRVLEVEKDWLPISFSKVGPVEPATVAFAGYGLVAPKTDEQEEYDSYVHLDVKDKWVLVLRFMPEGIPAERRQHVSRYSGLRYKAMLARDRGARGLIVVNGPGAHAKSRLVPLQLDGTLSGTSLPVLSVSNEVAAAWVASAGKDLEKLQGKLDTGDLMIGFEMDAVTLSGEIDLEQVKREGRNVLGRLQGGARPSADLLVVGAHIDHLGQGQNGSSLARDDEKDGIHFGADDNASGVASTLEIAEYLAGQKARGQLKLQRDILFAAWSGEELGLIGSAYFVKKLQEQVEHAHGHADPHGDGEHSGEAPAGIYPLVVACLNLDMVGRLEKKLIVQGVGSSTFWPGEIERRNAPIGLPITVQNDSYLPTDASSFFLAGVPILSAFTGSHGEYHTPRDTPDRLNYEGAAKVARFMGLVARSVAQRADAPDFVPQAAPPEGQRRANLRAYLGTIPDYAEEVKGLKLSGVAKGGPAEKGGLRAGDVIVELAGKKIENIYDYTYAIEALKIGEKVKVVVVRGEKRVALEVTPGSRE